MPRNCTHDLADARRAELLSDIEDLVSFGVRGTANIAARVGYANRKSLERLLYRHNHGLLVRIRGEQ